MNGEHDAQEQDQASLLTGTRSHSYDRWVELGQTALQGRRSAAFTLDEVLKECAALIIYEHWIANGRNSTKTAEVLGIGRKRVKRVMKAWRPAQGSEGGQQE